MNGLGKRVGPISKTFAARLAAWAVETRPGPMADETRGVHTTFGELPELLRMQNGTSLP